MKRKSAKAKTIGFFSGLRFRRMGRRDGKIGLPKETADGTWDSPCIEMLNKAFSQRQDEEYRNCAEETKELQIKCEELALEIIRQEKVLDELSITLAGSAASEETLLVRFSGEDHLPENAVRARRQREHDARFAIEREKAASSESFLRVAYSEVAALKAKIAEYETDTRLRVERVRANTDERILIYYHSAMRVHPLRDNMPAVPKLTATNGEATYLSSRNAEIARIKSMKRIKNIVQSGGDEYEAI